MDDWSQLTRRSSPDVLFLVCFCHLACIHVPSACYSHRPLLVLRPLRSLHLVASLLFTNRIGPHVKFGIPLVVRSLLICINSGSVYYSVSSFADIRNKLCGPAPVGGDKKHVKLDIKLPPPCLGYPGLTTVTRPHLSNCLLARKGSLQVSLFGPYLDH